jgi:hypothetical protein
MDSSTLRAIVDKRVKDRCGWSRRLKRLSFGSWKLQKDGQPAHRLQVTCSIDLLTSPRGPPTIVPEIEDIFERGETLAVYLDSAQPQRHACVRE